MLARNRLFRSVLLATMAFLFIFLILTLSVDTTTFLHPIGLPKEWSLSAVSPQKPKTYNIGILIIMSDSNTGDIKVAKDSLACYAKLQKYTLEYVYVNQNETLTKMCKQNDVSSFFNQRFNNTIVIILH